MGENFGKAVNSGLELRWKNEVTPVADDKFLRRVGLRVKQSPRARDVWDRSENRATDEL